MNVLLLCNKMPYPANDGSSIAIARMIEGYIEQGVKLTVVSLNTKKHYKDPAAIPATIRDKAHFFSFDIDSNPTVGRAFFNVLQRLPFHVSRFYHADLAAFLTQKLKDEVFDVVQCEGVFMMPYKLLIRQHSTAKVVLRAHNVEHIIWQRAADEHPSAVTRAFLRMQVKKLKRYETHCAKVADAVVAISPADAAFFAALNPHTFTSVCGVKHVNAVEKINHHKFFHLGAMDWLPNQRGIAWLLTEVWPKVHAQNPALQLHLGGRGMDESLPRLKQPGVFVHGAVDDAAAFRAKHGIMLVPLLAGSGLRIKIVEGLAEGLPIISTEIGAEGVGLVNGTNALLANTADDFAHAMLYLASDEEVCYQIGKNAATLATKSYLNSTIMHNLVATYRELWHIS